METTFNPELFKAVFQQNLNMLVNGMTKAAFETAVFTGNRVMTEDETRRFALNYFNKQLAKCLHDQLSTFNP